MKTFALQGDTLDAICVRYYGRTEGVVETVLAAKTPRAVAEMAKAGKLPAFYMTDPLKPRGKAELWINRREWDKYAAQLVDEAPTEWHDWKNRISYSKSRHGRAA
ncbi:hypothetical protein VEE42_12400 [Escherichia coli]|nr:hypothetical protein VEE42_12400 [Escherichia coli]